MSWITSVQAVYKKEKDKKVALLKIKDEFNVLLSSGIKTATGKVGFRALIRIGDLYSLEKVAIIRKIARVNSVSVRTDVYSLYRTFNDIPERDRVYTCQTKDKDEKEGEESED